MGLLDAPALRLFRLRGNLRVPFGQTAVVGAGGEAGRMLVLLVRPVLRSPTAPDRNPLTPVHRGSILRRFAAEPARERAHHERRQAPRRPDRPRGHQLRILGMAYGVQFGSMGMMLLMVAGDLPIEEAEGKEFVETASSALDFADLALHRSCSEIVVAAPASSRLVWAT